MTMKTIPRDDIGERRRQIARTTMRRNTLEYLAGGTAALFLLVMAVLTFFNGESAIDMLMAAGFAMLVLGMAIAGYHLFRNNGKGDGNIATSDVERLRRRLECERDLLRSAWLWYIVPLLPGFAMIYGGMFLAGNLSFAVVAGGLTLAFLLFVAVLNWRAAAQIEREIGDLRRHPQ